MTADPDLRAVLPQGGLTLFSRGAIGAADTGLAERGVWRAAVRF